MKKTEDKSVIYKSLWIMGTVMILAVLIIELVSIFLIQRDRRKTERLFSNTIESYGQFWEDKFASTSKALLLMSGTDSPGHAGAEAHRRCGPDRLPQCGQVHPHLHHQRGQAEDRQLPLHHSGAHVGRGIGGRGGQLRLRRHPRPDRRCQRGHRPGP